MEEREGGKEKNPERVREGRREGKRGRNRWREGGMWEVREERVKIIKCFT